MPVPTREEQLAMNEKVKAYIDARIRYNRLVEEVKSVTDRMATAHYEMQDLWHQCKNATPGVYSFKDHFNVVVVVDPYIDYPELNKVVV